MGAKAQRHRIAITGVGLLTSVGSNVKTSWAMLLAGKSGCAPIRRFPAASFPVRIAAEVPQAFWQTMRHASLAYTFGEQVILEALAMAGLPSAHLGPDTALVVGIGGDDDGGADHTFAFLDNLLVTAPEQDYTQLGEIALRSPSFVPQGENVLSLEHLGPALALRFGIEGEVLCVATACASGAHAVALAAGILRSGAASRVIAVGTDAMINRLSLANFCQLGVLSPRNASPETACRPFDTRRQGFILGEGAGAMVLEAVPDDATWHDRAQGYLIGYGVSADAYSITDKESDGTGVLVAIEQAMHDAGVSPNEITYINSHGTGTRQNDAGEVVAIRRAFGDCASQVPISSIKGQIGHTIAAAGIIEAIVTVLALNAGIAPGTSTLEHLSQDMADLKILGPGVHPIQPGLGLSLSAGFGGVNVSLILAGVEDKGR
jgi:3-oxoacyl-[acyl-carrier-protein] synthase-1/3-oxoacyl-[acyl-carrier-protein] synthase II